MGDKDDGLGLSLSLSLGRAQNQPSLKLNLMPLVSPRMQNLQQKNTWNELFQSSGMFLSLYSFVSCFLWESKMVKFEEYNLF